MTENQRAHKRKGSKSSSNGTSGFRRGFLLSSSTSSSKKVVAKIKKKSSIPVKNNNVKIIDAVQHNPNNKNEIKQDCRPVPTTNTTSDDGSGVKRSKIVVSSNELLLHWEKESTLPKISHETSHQDNDYCLRNHQNNTPLTAKTTAPLSPPSSSSSPFFIFSDDTNQPPQKKNNHNYQQQPPPQISVMNNDDSSLSTSLESKTIETQSLKPLITILSESKNNDEKHEKISTPPKHQSNEPQLMITKVINERFQKDNNNKNSEPLLFTEIGTVKRKIQPISALINNNTSDNDRGNGSQIDYFVPGSNNETLLSSNTPSIQPDEATNDDSKQNEVNVQSSNGNNLPKNQPPRESFTIFQKRFTALLWNIKDDKIKSTHENINHYSSILQQYTTQEWIWAWDCFLRQPQQNDGSNEALENFGITMIETNLDHFLQYMKQQQQQQMQQHSSSKLLLLSAMSLLKEYTTRCNVKQGIDWIKLMRIAFPIIVDCIAETRTVLAQEAMDTALKLYASAASIAMSFSTTTTNGKELSLQFVLFESFPILDQLFNLLAEWKGKKNTCTMALIIDWRLIYQDCCKETNYFIHNTNSSQLWCQHLNGCQRYSTIPQHYNDKNDNQQSKKESNIGSFRQTLCHDSSCTIWTPMQIKTFLQQIIQHVNLQSKQQKQEQEQESQSQQNSNYIMNLFYDVRACLRGIVAWFQQSKKNLFAVVKQPSLLEEIVSLLLNLLRIPFQECNDLVFSILNLIWSRSGGLPPDIQEWDPNNCNAEPPESFLTLLDTMQQTTKEQETSLSQALSGLAAKCILVKGQKLAEMVIARQGNDSVVTIDIFIATMQQHNHSASTTTTTTSSTTTTAAAAADNKENIKLMEYIGESLFDCITTSAYFRKCLKSKDTLFGRMSAQWSVPKHFKLFSKIIIAGKNHDNHQSLPAKLSYNNTQILVDSIGTSMIGILKYNMEQNPSSLKDLIAATLKALIDIEDSSNDKDPIDKICSQLFSRWSRYLLWEDQNDDNLDMYGSILIYICNYMFQNPSKMAPFVLFGTMMQEVSEKHDDNCNVSSATNLKQKQQKQIRIQNAVYHVVSLCVNQLKQFTTTTNDKTEKNNIFERLAPLLLLRRIPASYFQLYCNQISELIHVDSSKKKISKLILPFETLAKFLTIRLNIITSNETTTTTTMTKQSFITNKFDDNSNFTPEERKLSADIAGRCLFVGPIFDDNETIFHGCTLYSVIVKPAFSAMVQVLKDSTITISPTSTTKSRLDSTIKQAKVALYAVSNRVSLIESGHDNNNDTNILQSTTSYVLYIIENMGSPLFGNDNDTINDEFLQLQTGCMEFLSLILEKTMELKAKQELSARRNSPQILVSDYDKTLSNQSVKSNSKENKSTLFVLSTITRTILDLIVNQGLTSATDETRTFWERAFTKLLLNIPTNFTMPSQILLLWNSLTLVAQRCQQEQTMLLYADIILPWLVVDWNRGINNNNNSNANTKNDTKNNNNHIHSLCQAAAFQLAFVLATRTKKLPKNPNITKMAFQWALKSLGMTFTDNNSNNNNESVRLAALKFMTILIALDSGKTTQESSLDPRDLAESFSILKGMAHLDPNQAVQRLATQILQTIKATLE